MVHIEKYPHNIRESGGRKRKAAVLRIRAMGRLSKWWFGRFSDDWTDPSTTRGFLGGLVQAVLFFVLYMLLFLLWTDSVGPLAEYSTVGLVLSGVGGITVGGGLAYLGHSRERVREIWISLSTQFSTRGFVLLVALGGYWLILMAGATALSTPVAI